MFKITRYLFGIAALCCSLPVVATPVPGVRVNKYWMVTLDPDNQQNAIFQNFQMRTDSDGFNILENWAEIPEVTDIVLSSIYISPEANAALAGSYSFAEIRDNAFRCSENRNVYPDRYDFIQCIKTASLPSTVTTIGSQVFQNCGSLTSANIPASVTSLGTATFENCTSLVNVDFEPNLDNGILPANTFRNCTSLEEITLPESISNLGAESFAGCTALKSIVFKARALNAMASDAFSGVDLHGVTVTVPKGYKSNFSQLEALGASIVIDGIEPEVGREFEVDGVTYLTTSVDPLEVTLRSFTNKSFAGPVLVSAKVMFDGDLYTVKAIGDNAFSGCGGVTGVTFPTSLTSIGSEAFAGTAITSVTVPANITDLKPGVFQNCQNLVEVTIEANITALADMMFSNCMNLHKITLPSSIAVLGNEVFANCTALDEIFFNGTSVQLTDGALNGFDNLGNLVIVIPSAACLSGFDCLKDLVLCVKTPDGKIIYNHSGPVEYHYVPGACVTNESELEDGGLYFLHVSRQGDRTKQGYIIGLDSETDFAKYAGTYLNEFADNATDNVNYIWRIVKTDQPQQTGFHFKLQNFADPGRCFSKMGARGEAWQNVKSVSAPTNANAGVYHLEEPSGCTYLGSDETTRFWIRISNAKWSNPNSGSRDVSPCLMSNGGNGEETVAYWDYDTPGNYANYLQIAIFKAEEVQNVNVTLTFPDLNGATMVRKVNAPVGQSVENLIAEAVDNFNCGEFTVTGVTGNGEGNLVALTNTDFIVEGNWERQFIADRVYRLCVNPGDAPSALRYMLSTGEIETKREGIETLNRLVPERLWYFSSTADGKYTLHTLHNPSAAVAFGASAAGTHAALDAAGASAFEFIAKANGDFALKLNQPDEAYVSDYNSEGFLALSATDDTNATIRLYPLTANDFTALSAFADDATLSAAMAEPTFANILPLVQAFNARNLEAALKRVDYIMGEGMIGNNPGQYSDPSGEFVAYLEYAREIAAKGSEATAAEIESAVQGIEITDFDISTISVYHRMEPGVFYRFRNKQSNKYLSALEGGTSDGHAVMAMTDDASRSNTVFLAIANNETADPDAVEFTVVSFDNGLVLPKFSPASGESWLPAVSTAPTASNAVIFVDQSNGCFIIHTDGTGTTHRHLSGAGVTAVAGTAADNAYQWHIERVDELPLTLYNVVNIDGYPDNDGWASVFSPVAIEIPADSHLTAYTGIFDGNDYSETEGVNHVAATEIPADSDGKVIIPANQTALLFFDGDDDADTFGSQIESRSDITYINVPLVYGYEAEVEPQGNLSGGVLAFAPDAEKEYFTLHASHNNNFRELGEYRPDYTYIPGFKAYFENSAGNVGAYPIYLVNPNTMVAVPGDEGFIIEPATEDGMARVTVTTPDENYTVYHRHTLIDTPDQVRAMAADAADYEIASKSGNEHSFDVPVGSRVEYYAEHSSGQRGIVRHITVNADGSVGISSIVADRGAEKVCFDLMGRRHSAPVKGINIVNNKKVLLK